MNPKGRIIAVMLISLIFSAKLFSCTTFLVSGKYTADGKPLLFKNRDTKQLQNSLVYFTDGKYNYVGLVNGDTDWYKMVWGGYNDAGFAIINSDGCNNNVGDTSKFADQEGIIMKLALQTCRTLKDFENLLDSLKKPMGVDANFGVIDAYGGCAYYETGNYDYKKYDADDPEIAPKGILVRTNFTKRGEASEGYGYSRYNTAVEALSMAAKEKNITPQYLFNNLSRNLTHSITKTNLRDNLPKQRSVAEYKFFVDFIPRVSTASAIMIVGAKDEKNAKNIMMWTILGFPLTSIAIPTWIKGGVNLPKVISLNKNLESPLCLASLKLKKECYPVTYDKQWRYINLSAVINQEGNGIMQILQPAEDKIFKKANKLIAKMKTKGNERETEIAKYYKWLDNFLSDTFKKEFNIDLLKR